MTRKPASGQMPAPSRVQPRQAARPPGLPSRLLPQLILLTEPSAQFLWGQASPAARLGQQLPSFRGKEPDLLFLSNFSVHTLTSDLHTFAYTIPSAQNVLKVIWPSQRTGTSGTF